MEGKARIHISMKIYVMILAVFMISGPLFLVDTDISADPPKTSTRSGDELVWTQTTQEDFENGTISYLNDNLTRPLLEITTTGEVKLARYSENVIDNYGGWQNKIGSKYNVESGRPPWPSETAVWLLTNDDVIINETFGGFSHDSAKSVQQTPDGGYILAGGTSSYGVDGGDVWLIKVDSSGIEQWNKTFNQDEYDGGSSVQVTSDGGYIIAGHTGTYAGETQDIWLIKTDSSGLEEWNRVFDYNGSNDEGYSVQQTADGGYILTGKTFTHDPAFEYDVWLIKTDSSGNEEWNKTYDNSLDDEGYWVQRTSDGGYIITGLTYNEIEQDLWLIKTDSLGNEEWNKLFGGIEYDCGYSVQQTADGGYIITGVTMSFGSGGEDLWLIKTDSSGNEQWNKTFGDSSDEMGKSVQITSDGGYIIGGWAEIWASGINAWLIKTDGSGNEEWNKNLGGSGVDEFFYVNQTPDGNYIAVGATESFGAGDYDAWLMKIYAPDNVPDSAGGFTSINLVEGHNTSSIDSISFQAAIPSETGIKTQFSRDNSTWYDSSGNPNGWDILSDGTNQLDLSNLAWSGPVFYYRVNFTSNTSAPPMLFKMTFTYSEFHQSGTLISQSFDSETFPYWKRIEWTATVPTESDIVFQLRTSDVLEYLDGEDFVGYNGSSESFYTTSGQTIWEGHERDRYIQYKVYFSTSDTSTTPVLEEVSIIYEPIDTDDDSIEDFIDPDDDNDGMPDTWENENNLDPLNPADAAVDLDLDILTNLQEYLNSSNPVVNDTDGDSLGDGFEVIFSKTAPSLWDSNGNGIGDGLEFIQSQGYLGWIGSLPNDWIGMTISWENYTIYVKTNSSVLEGEFDKEEQKLKIKVAGPEGTTGVTEMNVTKGLCDPEDIEILFDGSLINFTLTEDEEFYNIRVEYHHSVHELITDFSDKGEPDNDGMDDLWELKYGLDIYDASDAYIDSDNDGLRNLQEFWNDTNPIQGDTDSDNLGDGFELLFSKTDPNDDDTDGNGIRDDIEFIQGQGYMGWMNRLSDDRINLTIFWDDYIVTLKTDSLVLDGDFDTENREITMDISGSEGTFGAVDIEIPAKCCEPGDIEVMLDGEPVEYTLTQDLVYYRVRVEYTHSVHELSVVFGQTAETPDPTEPEADEEGLLDYLTIIGLIIAIIVIILLLILITRNNNGKDNIGVQELPPEKLVLLLEQKHEDGEMTDETYEDIKTLLNKYNGG